ncbi:MAG: hypothetical protein RIC35_14945 [Marinoscillum sp.]
MKKYIQYLLLAGLLVVVIYPSFHLRSMLQQNLQVTHKMDQQLDSLWHLFHRYDETRAQYEVAYDQLLIAQHRVTQMEEQFTQRSASQQTDLQDIRQRLHLLTRRQKQLQLPAIESTDSLLFER